MTEENKIAEEKTCFCQSKGFRKFLIIACGTFVGVYVALSLFAAIHKPPMPMSAPAPMGGPCPCAGQMAKPFGPPPAQHFDKADRGDRVDLPKKMDKQRPGQPAPGPQAPGPVQRGEK